jgi:hypothetical protein
MATGTADEQHPSRLAEDGSHLRMTSEVWIKSPDKKKARLSGPSNADALAKRDQAVLVVTFEKLS